MIEKIRTILHSQFERDLFEASLASLNDTNNKLRLNNFAYSIRELSRHFLQSLSPEEDVMNCQWFTPEVSGKGRKKITSEKPTRKDKIRYAIHGGLSDEILEKIGYDLEQRDDFIDSILGIIGRLSKFTHIEQDVFDIDEKTVEETSLIVLKTFSQFVETIQKCNTIIQDALDNVISGHMIQEGVVQSFANIDGLAPHYSLDEIYVDEYKVIGIDDKYISVHVEGSVGVTLEWGSRSERAADDGWDVRESFPFQTTMKYEIDDSFPNSKYEVEPFDADTSEWWDGYYDD
jgi:hypothetical protein